MMAGKNTQIAAFLARLPCEGTADDGVSLRVLFPGDMVLTREQEEKFINWALERKREEAAHALSIAQRGSVSPRPRNTCHIRPLPFPSGTRIMAEL